MFENDLSSFTEPADVRRMLRGSRASRSSRSSRSAISRACPSRARARLRSRRAQIRPDAGARLRPAAGLQQRLAGGARRHRPRWRPISANWASARPNAACASASRRSPGAGTSTTTVMPGRWCGAPTTRRSGSFSTPSTSWRAGRTCRRSAPIPRDRIFLVQVADAPMLDMD